MSSRKVFVCLQGRSLCVFKEGCDALDRKARDAVLKEGLCVSSRKVAMTPGKRGGDTGRRNACTGSAGGQAGR